MATVFFSTGSNQGDRLGLLVKAMVQVEVHIGKVIDFSAVVESKPWGFAAETNFYNQVFSVETSLTPLQIITKILNIEKTLGRIRYTTSYESRIIDIDILFYDSLQVVDDKLVIPHPSLHLRRFVLEPLTMIAPELVHPVLCKTVSQLLDMLDNSSKIWIVANKEEFSKYLSN